MHKSHITIVENLPSLRSSDLINWNTISNQAVSGKYGNLLPHGLKYELAEEGLTINYWIRGELKTQHIEILLEPSNLGIGNVWFMICPFTDKKARKLVLWNGYFVHQSYIPNLHYKRQTENALQRTSLKWIRRMLEYQDIEKRQRQAYYKPTYNGKSTYLATKARRALERSAMAVDNQEEVWAWRK
jgi:hypothetical protein